MKTENSLEKGQLKRFIFFMYRHSQIHSLQKLRSIILALISSCKAYIEQLIQYELCIVNTMDNLVVVIEGSSLFIRVVCKYTIIL